MVKRRGKKPAPDTEVIEFDGIRYTRRPGKRYFKTWRWDSTQKRYCADSLHRAVWRFHYGDIPDDHDIHHKDGNWDNNDISNLECLSEKEHFQQHRDRMYRTPEQMRPTREGLARWFEEVRGTEEYREQCRRRIDIARSKAKPVNYLCEVCGACFTVTRLGGKKAKFCSRLCKSRGAEARKHVDKVCCVCDQPYRGLPESVCCSKSCSAKKGGRDRSSLRSDGEGTA